MFFVCRSAYRLYTVVPRLVRFVDQLTNWYVRMNRRRLRGEGSDGAEGAVSALVTLTSVLLAMVKMMAPFVPFLTEHMYQNLRKVLPEQDQLDSVHFAMLPQPRLAKHKIVICLKVLKYCS